MGKREYQSKGSRKTVLTAIGATLFIIAAILLFWLLLRGETKTTGEWNGIKTTESLSCRINNLPYSIYETNNILNSTTQINAAFDDDKINSISLLRKANYANAEIAKVENDALVAAINTDFGKNGMKAFALNATFSVNDSTTQMSLYANQPDLNSKSIKYFILDNLPSRFDDYQKAYQAKGFKCETTK